ncbi:MAG: lytic transglycosylase domain-containing protein [Alphaproteobacteria bacterium]
MIRFFLTLLALGLLGLGTASAAPLRPDQVSAIRAALAAADKSDWAQAQQRAAQSGVPLAVKLVDWMEMRRMGARQPFDQIAAFIAANPNWPSQEALKRRAEEAMDGATPDPVARAWFQGDGPRTPDGAAHYALVLLAAGNKAEAEKIARQAWVNFTFQPGAEQDFYNKFSTLLRPEDNAARLDRLVWDGQDQAARAMFPYVDSDQRAAADLRLRMRRGDKSAEQAVLNLPPAAQNSPGVLFERMRLARQANADDVARAILFAVPAAAPRPDVWWPERSILARRSLTQGNVTDAYRIAAGHGLSGGAAYAEAEWLAGWIALRYLNDAEAAKRHFDAMGARVATKVSRARAGYWSGRASEAAGRSDEAATIYAAAARHSVTFYGQLAAARIGQVEPNLTEPVATPQERQAFDRNELVRVVRLLMEVGRPDLSDPFLDRLDDAADTAGEQGLAVALAHEVVRPDMAVRLSRRAKRDDAIFLTFGYPTAAMPSGMGPELALVNAMIRQESAFNPQAVSSAGARGLLQLMPGTAKQVAKSLKLNYAPQKLTIDTDYNLKLGRAYMGQQVDDFAGSYILAVAAYNAGPGRVRVWLRTYGDPRDPEVDAVDWIESIPFTETRDYVQRVLEGVQVYRWRLGQARTVASLEKDLSRARGAAVIKVPVSASATAAATITDQPPPVASDAACGATGETTTVASNASPC